MRDNNESKMQSVEQLQKRLAEIEAVILTRTAGDVEGRRRYLLRKISIASDYAEALPAIQAQQTRDHYYRDIMQLHRFFLVEFPETSLRGVMETRYNVPECRFMTVEQLRDLRNYMRTSMSMAPVA